MDDQQGPLFCCTCVPGVLPHLPKRNFAVTAEPPPRDVPSGPEAIFVVQKHTAQRAGLHWDVRLEAWFKTGGLWVTPKVA